MLSRKSEEYISCFQHCQRKPDDVAAKPDADAPKGSISNPRFVDLLLACQLGVWQLAIQCKQNMFSIFKSFLQKHLLLTFSLPHRTGRDLEAVPS